MTIQQALRKARKLWGPKALVQINPRGGFIGEDRKWHDSIALCCQHGKSYERCEVDRKCPQTYHRLSFEPLKLGRIRNVVPEYSVGREMLGFFEVRGNGESFEVAFEKAIARWPGVSV